MTQDPDPTSGVTPQHDAGGPETAPASQPSTPWYRRAKVLVLSGGAVAGALVAILALGGTVVGWFAPAVDSQDVAEIRSVERIDLATLQEFASTYDPSMDPLRDDASASAGYDPIAPRGVGAGVERRGAVAVRIALAGDLQDTGETSDPVGPAAPSDPDGDSGSDGSFEVVGPEQTSAPVEENAPLDTEGEDPEPTEESGPTGPRDPIQGPSAPQQRSDPVAPAPETSETPAPEGTDDDPFRSYRHRLEAIASDPAIVQYDFPDPSYLVAELSPGSYTNGEGSELTPGELAERLAATLASVQTVPGEDGLLVEGWTFSVDVRLHGLKGVPVVLTWALNGTDVPDDWAASRVAYRMEADTEDDGGPARIWVPRLRAEGTYVVVVTLRTESDGTMLAQKASAEITP
ncbi:hypothetical protein [Agromyces sp. SYSU T00194]|uniref:hypothetical protein n=1 Tax=Agromyces chitinivorans TaxID=3158560 RepID=UPI003397F19F